MMASRAWVLCVLLGCASAAAASAPGNSAKAMARTALAGAHAAMKVQEVRPPAQPVDAALKDCILAIEARQLEGVAQQNLLRLLGASDLRLADKFFATEAGRKYVAGGEVAAYKAMAIEPPTLPPDRTDADDKKVDEFFASPAGKKFSAALTSDKELLLPINARIRELAQSCASSRRVKTSSQPVS